MSVVFFSLLPETKKVVEETIERTQFGVRTEDSQGIPALESRLAGFWLFIKLMANQACRLTNSNFDLSPLLLTKSSLGL